jgi:uncharacterized protein YeaO (DUF488 family)
MNIQTSYFAKMRSFPKDVVPIAICAKPPSWYTGLVYKKLAPSYSILMEYKANPDKEKYTQRFLHEIVSYLDFQQVYSDLYNLSEGKDIIMLCFEKSSDFCHRHIIAEEMSKALNIDIIEFGSELQKSDSEIDR